jgi:hypothetical protein
MYVCTLLAPERINPFALIFAMLFLETRERTKGDKGSGKL